MKLSEAILAGSTLCKAKAAPCDREDSSNETGCALTMAALAVGRTGDGIANAWQEAHKQWPWLNGDSPVSRCPADHCYVTREIVSCEELVFHLFDYHVFEPEKGCTLWTLEQLADYVKTIEPPEPEEEDEDDFEEEEDLRGYPDPAVHPRFA